MRFLLAWELPVHVQTFQHVLKGRASQMQHVQKHGVMCMVHVPRSLVTKLNLCQHVTRLQEISLNQKKMRLLLVWKLPVHVQTLMHVMIDDAA